MDETYWLEEGQEEEINYKENVKRLVKKSQEKRYGKIWIQPSGRIAQGVGADRGGKQAQTHSIEKQLRKAKNEEKKRLKQQKTEEKKLKEAEENQSVQNNQNSKQKKQQEGGKKEKQQKQTKNAQSQSQKVKEEELKPNHQVHKKDTTSSSNQSSLFAHLEPYKQFSYHAFMQKASQNEAQIHRSIIDIAFKFCSGQVKSANSRCTAMLLALSHYISDYQVPSNKELYRDLPGKLQQQYNFLVECYPATEGLQNAFKHVMKLLTGIKGHSDEEKAKRWLVQNILDYIKFSIVYASRIIGQMGAKIIKDGDTLMVYASSQSIFQSILQAKKEGKQFNVIIIDSRPFLDGREAFTMYTRAGIECQYILLQSMSFHIKKASKLLIGAISMKSNGSLVSNIGSATVACIAAYFKVPTLVFCEIYKFGEKCQLDAICANQFGNPDKLVSNEMFPGSKNIEHKDPKRLEGWRNIPNLTLLNVKFDLTPTKYISQVVCELGSIPPSSIPVLIREYVQNIQVEYSQTNS